MQGKSVFHLSKKASSIGNLVIFCIPKRDVSRGYRKEVNSFTSRTSEENATETTVALGNLLYLCVPKRYVSRGHRKEVNSIRSRMRKKKKSYVQKNGLEGLGNDSSCFHSPPGLWERLICLAAGMLWLCTFISDEVLQVVNQPMSVRSRFVRMSSEMAMLLR